jgi:hypothetical protein
MSVIGILAIEFCVRYSHRYIVCVFSHQLLVVVAYI